MRKLNLSERRDSFKKQEAVQEVSFDEPDEKTSTAAPVACSTPQVPTQHQKHRMAWVHQTSEEVELEVPAVRRFTLVPQIAVQGSTESEQDEWEPCSDGEETDEKTEQEVAVSLSEPQQAGCSVADCSQAAGRTAAAAATEAPQAGSSTPHNDTWVKFLSKLSELVCGRRFYLNFVIVIIYHKSLQIVECHSAYKQVTRVEGNS